MTTYRTVALEISLAAALIASCRAEPAAPCPAFDEAQAEFEKITDQVLDPTMQDPRFAPVAALYEAVPAGCPRRDQAQMFAKTIRDAQAARAAAPPPAPVVPPPAAAPVRPAFAAAPRSTRKKEEAPAASEGVASGADVPAAATAAASVDASPPSGQPTPAQCEKVASAPRTKCVDACQEQVPNASRSACAARCDEIVEAALREAGCEVAKSPAAAERRSTASPPPPSGQKPVYCAYFLASGSRASHCFRGSLADGQKDCDARLKAQKIEGTCACTDDESFIGSRCG